VSKPFVYVAGPITGDPFGCVRQATDAWRILRADGCVPFLPQLSVLHQMVDPQTYDAWLDYDNDIIERCDALLRLPGVSPGGDAEVDYALLLGIPVFYEAAEVGPWFLDKQAQGRDDAVAQVGRLGGVLGSPVGEATAVPHSTSRPA
jgi:nucleoside 2-deoxyribosyltransferase